MKTKKLFSFVSMGIAALLSITIVALDNDSNWVVGRTCDWSPTIVSETAEGVSDTVVMQSRFYFTEEAKTAILRPILNFKFTFEHRTTEGTPVSVTDQYSFLPNPTFDKDDDDGDGYFEESEVTCGSCEDIQVGYNYYLSSWFSKPATHTAGAFDSIGQMSLKAWIGNEYDAWASDYYGSIGWQTLPPSSSTQSVRACARMEQGRSETEKHLQGSNDEKMIKLFSEINSRDELDAYRDEICASYNEIKALSDREMIRTSDNDVTNAVITFCRPVTLEFVRTLLTDDCELVNYEAKFTNVSGEWMTMCSSRLSENDLVNVAVQLSGDDEVVFCGITSATVVISPYGDMYETLRSVPDIYLVDMSEFIIRSQNKCFSNEIIVSDCYYYLEKYAE